METSTAFDFTVHMRSYLSSHHLWAAEHFAKLAKEIEDTHTGRPRFIQHRAYVLAAISSSVAFLEGAVNEIYEDVVDGHKGYVDGLSSETSKQLTALWKTERPKHSLERKPILDKYQEALRCCGAELFDKGRAPYQDAQLLICLRNELIHARPETASASDDDQVERRKQMNSKFQPNHLMETSTGNPYFPDHCLGAGCAAWAVKSARALADEFTVRTKIKPNYQRVDFELLRAHPTHC